MKFVFFGADDFSVIVLGELKNAGFLPSRVVTAPDRPKGRGLKLSALPVKLWALENGIEFLQPDTLDSSVSYQLKAKSYQLFIVASYGLILPKPILDIPERGTVNVHPSLLPKYRGATPIESQILNDEKEIGVTIMLIDERMDHGPIVAQKLLQIPNPNNQIPNNTQINKIQTPKASELRKTLAEEGGKLLAEVIPRWVAGEIQPVPQDDSQATYTKKLTKADGEIDLSGDAYKNFLKIRAFDGSIGTYFYYSPSSPFQGEVPSVRGGGVGAVETTPPSAQKRRPPLEQGRVEKKIRVKITDADFRDRKLAILRVIPEGKKEMSYEEFLRGLK